MNKLVDRNGPDYFRVTDEGVECYRKRWELLPEQSRQTLIDMIDAYSMFRQISNDEMYVLHHYWIVWFNERKFTEDLTCAVCRQRIIDWLKRIVRTFRDG